MIIVSEASLHPEKTPVWNYLLVRRHTFMAPTQVRMGACLLRNHLTHEGAPTSKNEGLDFSYDNEGCLVVVLTSWLILSVLPVFFLFPDDDDDDGFRIQQVHFNRMSQCLGWWNRSQADGTVYICIDHPTAMCSMILTHFSNLVNVFLRFSECFSISCIFLLRLWNR